MRLVKRSTSKQPILLTAYRSGLEEKMGDQLEKAGVPFAFEPEKLPYLVPERTSTYTPDFVLIKKDGGKMYIEAKGRFGGDGRGKTSRNPAQERQKLILIKEQHPSIDLRIIFQRAATPIYKGSPTTYAKWAETHGFPWADKGTVPQTWIEEVKASTLKEVKHDQV
jgi:hypothetical protein